MLKNGREYDRKLQVSRAFWVPVFLSTFVMSDDSLTIKI